MLCITVPAIELYDDEKNEFIIIKEQTLELEHSLVSLSKWESKWCKTFLSKKEKTDEEVLDYIKCMTLTQNINPEVYACLGRENFEKIDAYINAPMTAVYFPEEKEGSGGRKVVTSEVIYDWMFSLNIPLECQEWHLNRLVSQIRVTSVKNQPRKKMSQSEIMSRNRQLNEERKQKWNTKG